MAITQKQVRKLMSEYQKVGKIGDVSKVAVEKRHFNSSCLTRHFKKVLRVRCDGVEQRASFNGGSAQPRQCLWRHVFQTFAR